MDLNWQSRVKELFLATRGKQSERREEYLDQACGKDTELRREVESLLNEHDRQHMESGAPTTPEAAPGAGDPLIGGTLDRYRILGMLGRGGMGVVYEAEDPELRRKVALKVLPEEFAVDPNRLERFKREARSVAALSHPNIVTLYSVEAAPSPAGSGDLHFLTMELVEGEPLDRLIPKQGLDLGEILGRATQLADGLRAAHEQGIVHRDLKPANVIVDTEGRLRILDFGLAKAQHAQPESTEVDTSVALTVHGTVLGTAPYMSPEQVAGRVCDHRSDIFSLGSILYEMSSGRRPFSGESFTEVMSAILQDDPRPVTDLRADLPEGLVRIISRCLEKDPAKRFQTARAVRDALEELRSTARAGTRRLAGYRWAAIAATVAVVAVLGFLTLNRSVSPSGETDSGSTATATEPARKKIAVLPLRNLGPAEDEFFAAGITEEIITRLATVRRVDLISTGGSAAFEETDAGAKEIGEALGVDFVLSGSVRWARQDDGSSRVRISPRLIRVEDSVHLWAEAYDRTMEDIFEIQAEIASSVARELGAALLEPERLQLQAKPTENQEAYQAYLRGRFAPYSVLCDPVRKRIVYLRRAVELDPNFLQAWAVLSQSYSASYAHCPEFEERDRIESRRALSRAQELDPDAWQVLVAEAQYLTQVEQDYVRALEPLEKANAEIETSEIHFAKGRAYRRQGRWNEALAAFERAAELNPMALDKRIASVHMWMRNYAQAIEHYDREIERTPGANNFFLRKAWIYWLWKGTTAEARAVLETLRVDEPSMLIQWGWFWQRIYEGRIQEAVDGLDVVPDQPMMRTDIYAAPKPLLRAQAFDLMDEPEMARAEYEQARVILEAAVRNFPASTSVRCALAIAYAGLGLETEALKTAVEVLAMVPIDQEPYFGGAVLEQTSLAYTMLGDYEAALDGLETLLGIPSVVSIPWLRLDPRWAPLRDQPKYLELEKRFGEGSSIP